LTGILSNLFLGSFDQLLTGLLRELRFFPAKKLHYRGTDRSLRRIEIKLTKNLFGKFRSPKWRLILE